MKKTRRHKPQRKKSLKKESSGAPASSMNAPATKEPTQDMNSAASSLSSASSSSMGVSASPQSSLALSKSAAPPVQKVGILDFLRQVRSEASRVTWPTRNETIVTTIMVFIMVTLAALFFLAADQILSRGVAFILGVFGR